MNDQSAKRNERILIFSLIIVFILLFVLSSTNACSCRQETPETDLQDNYTSLMDEPFLTGPALEQETDGAESEAETKKQESQTVAAEQTPEQTAGQIEEELSLETPERQPAALPFVQNNTSLRQLQVTVQVTNTGNKTSSNISLEVPMLGLLDSPYQTTVGEVFSHEPADIKELELQNRSALFRISNLSPGDTETITLAYSLEVQPGVALSAAHVAPAARYLRPSPNIESDHPDMVRKAAELTAAISGDREKAAAIFNFVLDHLSYDLQSPYRNSGALSALHSGSGVCEEYAALFVALCRAAGIPARQVNGYADPRGSTGIWDLDPGEIKSLSGYRHSWAEFYLEGQGWLPADPTLNIYDKKMTYFASLPEASHLAQNYLDHSLRARYRGGQLAVTWDEKIVGQ